jgi:hypothetical protein
MALRPWVKRLVNELVEFELFDMRAPAHRHDVEGTSVQILLRHCQRHQTVHCPVCCSRGIYG